MSNFDGEIDPSAGWLPVPQLSTEALAMGGPDGPMNAQATALAARTKHLLENMADASAVEAAAAKADTALAAADIANDTAATALNTAQAAESLAEGAFDAATNALGMVQLVGGMKNRIINGKMEIAQRGVSFPAIAGGSFMVDRFVLSKTGTSAVLTGSRSMTGPNSEFLFSIKMDVTTADTSIQAADVCSINQILEASAITDLVGNDFVLSFWVMSSKPGVYCVSFRNELVNQAYVAEYEILQPNVFEFKTVVVRGGLTAAGSWNYGPSVGLRLGWNLASGSDYNQGINETWVTANRLATANQVNFLDTVGASFSLTGVQLERGVVSTAYEHRLSAIELALCQRYYEIMTSVFQATIPTTSTLYSQSYWKVTKRVTPTIIISQISGTSYPPFSPAGDNMVYQSNTAAVTGSASIAGSAEF